jgi:hypothetical protein
VKSGPDVFADALVPSAAAIDARRVRFPKSHRSWFLRPSEAMKTRDCVSGAHRAAMVIVLRNGTVNRILRSVDNPRESGTFAISPASARKPRLRRIHRDR